MTGTITAFRMTLPTRTYTVEVSKELSSPDTLTLDVGGSEAELTATNARRLALVLTMLADDMDGGAP